MKTLLIIFFCILIQPIAMNYDNHSSIDKTIIVRKEKPPRLVILPTDNIVYKLNYLEKSLNNLNKNLVKLDSLK